MHDIYESKYKDGRAIIDIGDVVRTYLPDGMDSADATQLLAAQGFAVTKKGENMDVWFLYADQDIGLSWREVFGTWRATIIVKVRADKVEAAKGRLAYLTI